MSRRSPRALLLWAGALALALVTALVVGRDLATLHRRAAQLGPEQPVAVATRDLPMGTTIGGDDIETRLVHRDQLPPGTVGPADAPGRVVLVPLVRGAFVASANLAPRERSGLDAVVPPGMRIVRIVVEGGGALQPGAAVDVLATLDVSTDPAGASYAEPTVVVAEGVTVVAVDEGVADATTGRTGNGVTLLVTPDEARQLAYATATGEVTVALVPPEDAKPPPSEAALPE